MQEDTSLTNNLRKLFLEGHSVAQLIEFIEFESGFKSALLTVFYFGRAFGLTIKQSMDVMSYSFFGGGDIGAKELEERLRPLIEANKHEWAP